jgi:Ni/Fe-hydrogenase subunit HybB-like protein
MSSNGRHTERFEAVAGPLFTKPFVALAALAALALVLIPVRFAIGLGPSSGVTDGYPWGLWKIVNVIILTGVASGGYTVALIVYGFAKQSHHALARHAIATSAVGYTSGVIALGVVDLGRPWNFWRLVDPRTWNLHSVLLEVGICVSAYIFFLWMEMAPPVLEAWSARPQGRLRGLARWAMPWLDRAYPWIVAAAVTLPTMHQSSLGSLFLLAGPRLHGLWQTPLLPLFFLLSAWILGLSAVIIAVMLANIWWSRPVPGRLVGQLSRWNAVLVLFFFILRVTDISIREHTAEMVGFNRFSISFLVELALMLPPALLLIYGRRKQPRGRMFRMALVTLTGAAFYRFNVCLGGFMPGTGWVYFPSVLEILISAGLCALGVVAYIIIAKRLPVIDNPPAKQQNAGTPLSPARTR